VPPAMLAAAGTVRTGGPGENGAGSYNASQRPVHPRSTRVDQRLAPAADAGGANSLRGRRQAAAQVAAGRVAPRSRTIR